MESLETRARSSGCLPEIRLHERPWGGLQWLFVDAFLAADRPDRLELAAAWPRGSGKDAPSQPDGQGALRPGAAISLWVEGRRLFAGEVARVARGLDGQRGWSLSIVAYASYHGRRAALKGVAFRQLTDSELAARVASSLELIPVTESGTAMHSLVILEEDPLAYLRAQARRSGFQLAVSDGKLYFQREVPPLGEPLHLNEQSRLLSLSVVERGLEGAARAGRGPALGGQPGKARGGELEVLGDPGWKPLSSFEAAGFGIESDGHYRTVRALHRWDAGGYRTRVEFLENGLDLGAWSGWKGKEHDPETR